MGHVPLYLMKRTLGDSPQRPAKRIRRDGTGNESLPTPVNDGATMPKAEPRPRIVKLAPPRPFPTVPRSVSATGPRSAHKEGKNLICITRKTPLAAYLRRCKNLIIADGWVQ